MEILMQNLNEVIGQLQKHDDKIGELLCIEDTNQTRILSNLYVEFKKALNTVGVLSQVLGEVELEKKRLQSEIEKNAKAQQDLERQLEVRIQSEVSKFRRVNKNDQVRTRMSFYIPVSTKEKLRLISADTTMQATLETLIMQAKDGLPNIPLVESEEKVIIVAWIDYDLGNFLRSVANANGMKMSKIIEMMIENEANIDDTIKNA